MLQRQPGTRMRMRRGRVTRHDRRAGACVTVTATVAWGRVAAAWRSRTPPWQYVGAGLWPLLSGGSSPWSTGPRSPAEPNQAKETSSRASRMHRVIPIGSPRCIRPAQTVLGARLLECCPAWDFKVSPACVSRGCSLLGGAAWLCVSARVLHVSVCVFLCECVWCLVKGMCLVQWSAVSL